MAEHRRHVEEGLQRRGAARQQTRSLRRVRPRQYDEAWLHREWQILAEAQWFRWHMHGTQSFKRTLREGFMRRTHGDEWAQLNTSVRSEELPGQVQMVFDTEANRGRFGGGKPGSHLQRLPPTFNITQIWGRRSP